MGNKPILLGITGGIGSGKSTVCRIFSVLGIPMYNADDRAKKIVSDNPEVRSAIEHIFGPKAYVQGKYNNTWIASIVFESSEMLQRLNSVVHPAVAKDFEQWVQANRNSAPYLVKEAAILLETGSAAQLDHVLVVHAPNEVRIERVLKRDPHRTVAQVKNIIENQMKQEEMLSRASFSIDNSGKVSVLPQVLAINSSIINLVSSK